MYCRGWKVCSGQKIRQSSPTGQTSREKCFTSKAPKKRMANCGDTRHTTLRAGRPNGMRVSFARKSGHRCHFDQQTRAESRLHARALGPAGRIGADPTEPRRIEYGFFGDVAQQDLHGQQSGTVRARGTQGRVEARQSLVDLLSEVAARVGGIRDQPDRRATNAGPAAAGSAGRQSSDVRGHGYLVCRACIFVARVWLEA